MMHNKFYANFLHIAFVALLLSCGNISSAQTTLNLQVSSGSDNADQDTGGTVWVNDDYAVLGGNYCGWRFQNVTIPQGATITNATLELRIYQSGTSSFGTNLVAQDADTTSAFSSSSYNISNRTPTSASVNWSVGSTSFTDGQIITSPDISSVIKEVVDRGGWSSGNSLVIVGQPSSGGKAIYKRAGNTSYAAKLDITYSTIGGSSGKTLLLITADSSLTGEESTRKSQFESWGYTVNTVQDGDAQATIDAALAGSDVVYIPYSVDGAALSSKIRAATIGVVYEAVSNLDYQFGLSNGGANGGSPNTTTDIVDTTHPITSGLSDPLTIFSSSAYQRSVNAPVSSSTTLGVLNGTINPALSVLETGVMLANTINSNSVAAGRRVRLPFGGGVFTWSQITSGGRTLIQNSLDWASSVSANKPLLLVTAGATPSSEENLRVSEFEGWGYDVSTIEDGSSQASYDAALSATEVVYIPNTVDHSSVSTKLRLAECGIVSELEKLDTEIGFGSSDGGWSNGTTIDVFNKDHPVTQGFSTGTLSIFGSNARLSFVQGTPAPAGVGLAYLFTTDSPDLMAIEEGGELANTQVSNTHAAGRRVRLPIADGTFDWGDLNSNGLTLIEQSLSWASSHAGLKGHWKLDETSGTTAVDSSENEIDGTYANGATPGSTGVRLYAADFDGVDDHITINGGNELNITQSVTVACWAKSDTATWSGWGCLVSKRNQFYIHPSAGSTSLYFGADKVGAGDESAGVDMAEIGSIQQWHHYIGVYDYENAEVRLYVDGVLRATTSVTPGMLLEGDTGALTIGWDDGITGTRYFDGQIDDVRLYDKAVSDAEIAEMYGLIGHWKLSETSGNVANDSSGIGNDGNYWNGSTPGSAGPYPGEGAEAAEFNGTTAHVGIYPIDAYDDITETISVAAWVNFNTATAEQTQQEKIVHREDYSSNLGCSLLADQPYGDRIIFRVHNGSTVASATWHEPGIVANEWHHFVGTYDGATVRLYCDGQEVASTPFASAIEPHTAGNLSVGAQLDGRVFDARLYNRAISQAEIAEIYGLVAWWKLDETSGSVAYDSSGMGHDAVLTGTPAWTNGRVNGGHAFDYTDGEEYFTAPSNGTLDNLQENDYSVSAFFKPFSIPPGSGSDNDYGYGLLVKRGWHIGIVYNNVGELVVDHFTTGDLWYGSGTWGESYGPGSYSHVVGVVSISEGTAKIYVNGELKNTNTFTPGTATRDYGSALWRIGMGAPGGGSYGLPCDGIIDDARLYNRALGDEQVLQLYSSLNKNLRITKWLEVR